VIATIEETAKLQLPQEKVLGLHSYGVFTTRSESNIRQLLHNALDIQPDYLVADSVVSTAIQELLNSSVPFITTLDSGSPYHAVDSLYDYYKRSETQLSAQIICQQIVSGVHLIVQVEHLPVGLRRITSISEISENGDTIAIIPLFALDKRAHDATLQQVGKLSSRLRHYLSQQALEERLQQHIAKLL
jgi:pilus assembly protein CpaF